MGQLLKRYDYDVKKALAAYNGGMRRIDNSGLPTLKPETQKYLKNILGE
jgi:soluble lytic murein transglycosylase-like protein